MTIGLKRILVILISIAIQFLLVGVILYIFPNFTRWILGFLSSIAFIIALFVIRSDISPDYKLTWVFIIFVAPIIGVIIFLIANRKKRSHYNNHLKVNAYMNDNIKDDSLLLDNYSGPIKREVNYLKKYAKTGVFKGNDTKYYPLGELIWEDMLVELKKAEKFIFMEYFIVQKGKMLDSIVEILKQKASEGVEVRFMFDSFGSIMTLPKHFSRELEEAGIKCYPFNSKVRLFDFGFNNRDHRKITVIDGKVAFTGGINLADEYINEIAVYGHWKDSGIKIVGSAVNMFTLMFLTVWAKDEDMIDECNKYVVGDYDVFDNNGFVSPYSYYPHSNERVGEVMYNSMFRKAKDYVYITTPYLILDYTMLNEIRAAAKEGVDIRIMMPGIPDKKTVFMLSRSFYRPLLEAGVRIFEYTPGFIHSKHLVSDDSTAIVGTINLDYRSLTHHFENAVWLLNDKSIMDIKKDFLETQDKCVEIIVDDVSGSKLKELVALPILRAFAPLF